MIMYGTLYDIMYGSYDVMMEVYGSKLSCLHHVTLGMMLSGLMDLSLVTNRSPSACAEPTERKLCSRGCASQGNRRLLSA